MDDEVRIIREKLEALERALRRKPATLGEDAGEAFVGRVIDGGAMAENSLGRFILVNRISVSGEGAEGSEAVKDVDESADVPVVWLGRSEDPLGRDVIVERVGDLWFAEDFTITPPCVPCEPCCIPRSDLTVSWTNVLVGGSSTRLVFDGVRKWQSQDCHNQLRITLECVDGQTAFSVEAFTTGECPDGPRATCSTAGGTLRSTSVLCDPFMLTYSPVGTPTPIALCPHLVSRGYTNFAVTL